MRCKARLAIGEMCVFICEKEDGHADMHERHNDQHTVERVKHVILRWSEDTINQETVSEPQLKLPFTEDIG